MFLPTTDEMKKEILTVVTTELETNGFEVTSQHLIWALEGLSDAWKEDDDMDFVKSRYQLALIFLILDIKLGMIKEYMTDPK